MFDAMSGYDLSDLIAVVAAVNMITGALLPLIPRDKSKPGSGKLRNAIGKFGAIAVGVGAGLLLAVLSDGAAAGLKVGIVGAWTASGAHNTPTTIAGLLNAARGVRAEESVDEG